MTESYGYYCPQCKTRWRTSVCKDDMCPAGHILTECFWVYHQSGAFGHRIVIKSEKLEVNETFPFTNSLMEWIQKKQLENPAFAEVFNNTQYTSSASENDWPHHCLACTYSVDRIRRYPDEIRFNCAMNQRRGNIYCKYFQRNTRGPDRNET